VPATFLGVRATAAVRHLVDRCASTSAGTDTVFDVLDDLQQLVGCDWVVFTRHDTPGRRLRHTQSVASGQRRLASPVELEAQDYEAFWRWYWRCEPCALPDRVETPVQVAISDFYTAREWARHPMSETLGRLSDELVVSYPEAPGLTRRLLFARENGACFEERERFLIALLMPHIGPLLARTLTPPQRQDVALTDRQREVLGLVRLGMANKQIAQALKISTGTVRKHLEHAYDRLGVQSRTEALRATALDHHPPPVSHSA
jgi:DNA-binding CsgD family transcriptional regulator